MSTEDAQQDKPKPTLRHSVVAAVRNFMANDGFFLSAGIAYYGLFSIVPIALLTVNIAGFFISTEMARARMEEALTEYLGREGATLVARVLHDMSSRGSATGTAIGAILLLYGASRLFLRLQKSFNLMWGVRASEAHSPYRRFLSRLLTFSMILLPAVILCVAFAVSTGAAWLASVGLPGWIQGIAEAIGPLVIFWMTMCVIFVALPDVRLSLHDVWATALLAAVLLSATMRVFGYWISRSTDSSMVVLTSVSLLMTLIVWVNVIAIILLCCVSLTRVRYEARGNTIRPYPHAARFHVTTE